jgi:hypothetical protein
MPFSRSIMLVPTLLSAVTIAAYAADTKTVEAQLAELKQAQAKLEAQVKEMSRGSNSSVAGALKLLDIALTIEAIGGASTERDESIQNLQGGGHDPKQRGFTMPNAELFIGGAVDPYFYAQSNLVFFISEEGETVIELEEAVIRTQALPYGLEFKAGQFFTEFGRINQTHPHAWTWIDQPIINSRVFGGDGMRGQGLRASVSLPTPWLSDVLVTAQNARGETMSSFIGEGEGLAGREYIDLETDTRNISDLAWSGRWANAIDISDDLTLRVGGSLVVGPNASGIDTNSMIYGGHLALRWRPAGGSRGFPFVTWETEVIGREAEVDEFVFDPGGPDETTYAADTLNDWGLFTQLMVGFTDGWSAGLRYELATGSGESVDGREADPLRDDRTRISPLIAWQPTEFSRLRLQYNYDKADHLSEDDAHSVWLALDIIIGTHPPHLF